MVPGLQRPNLSKFDEPTVEGVDYPRSASPSRATTPTKEPDVETYAATKAARGSATTIRVIQLPDADAVRITCDGADFGDLALTGADAIELVLTIDEHVLVVRTGYHGRDGNVSRTGHALRGQATARRTSCAEHLRSQLAVDDLSGPDRGSGASLHLTDHLLTRRQSPVRMAGRRGAPHQTIT